MVPTQMAAEARSFLARNSTARGESPRRQKSRELQRGQELPERVATNRRPSKGAAAAGIHRGLPAKTGDPRDSLIHCHWQRQKTIRAPVEMSGLYKSLPIRARNVRTMLLYALSLRSRNSIQCAITPLRMARLPCLIAAGCGAMRTTASQVRCHVGLSPTHPAGCTICSRGGGRRQSSNRE